MGRVSKNHETFHFNRRSIHDTIWVQKLHDYVNDDEEHEEHPHLQDFLIPHHRVHIETEEEAKEHERERESIEQEQHPDNSQEKQRPVLERPCPSILHKADCPSRMEEKARTSVSFHEVTVREYETVLGDHPCCRFGVPVTLSWDYLEYEPLPVNEYEIHHSRRRTVRQLYLNADRRTEILTNIAGHSKKEIRNARNEVARIKRRRRQSTEYPWLNRVDYALERTRRKLRKVWTKGSE